MPKKLTPMHRIEVCITRRTIIDNTIGILVDDDCTVPTFKRCPDIRLTIGSSAISFQIIAINNWCVWNMGLTNQQSTDVKKKYYVVRDAVTRD